MRAVNIISMVIFATLVLPVIMAQSNCEKCATQSDCSYSSSASKNKVTLHSFCGMSSGTFYCCPTTVDGRSAECDTNNVRGCRYRSDSSSSSSSSSSPSSSAKPCRPCGTDCCSSGETCKRSSGSYSYCTSSSAEAAATGFAIWLWIVIVGGPVLGIIGCILCCICCRSKPEVIVVQQAPGMAGYPGQPGGAVMMPMAQQQYQAPATAVAQGVAVAAPAQPQAQEPAVASVVPVEAKADV
mmetsp:Transcript_33941/g.82728  ORF Transcript_33941/g.82728 Transcript_33941/m.82728 type:complete len:240 (-) Transcript_33941:216-935(-)